MKPLNRLQATLFAAGLIAVIGDSAGAQDLGPFMPHEGATLTTAWANSYGPDAEAWMTLFNVTPQTFDVITQVRAALRRRGLFEPSMT